MPAAMNMVREALGEHAIILSTSHKGKGPVTITAAVDEDAEDAPPPKASTPRREAAPARPIQQNNEQADQLRYDMQEVLRFHNVPELFIAKIIQQASDKDLASFLALQNASRAPNHSDQDAQRLLSHGIEKLLSGFFEFMPLDFSTAGMRLMLVGPPGIGKTLTVAKIAAKLVMEEDAGPKALTVITTDNKRAGGFEQLQSLTNILGVELQAANDAGELKTLLSACKPRSRVLIDTAGCNPYDASEIAELKAYTKFGNIEPVMVLPAGGDSLESIDVVEAFMALPIERMLITRADTARRFGGILAAAASHKLAFCQSSSSSSIIDSLSPLDAGDLAGLLLNYKTYKH